MALRARYGPGNRAWSYQRPADDAENGPPLQPSAFGLALSAEEHTPAPDAPLEQLTPVTTAVDAVRAASGAAKARTRSDASASTAAARAARAAKASAARSARASTGSTPAAPTSVEADSAPRRRSGRVPATTAKARAPSPTHTAAPQRTAKRKRSTLVPDVLDGLGVESGLAPVPPPSGVLPPSDDGALSQDAAAPRATRGAGAKRPRISHKDLDAKLPRADDPDESKRTTFGSTTTAPDPFTALSAADLSSNQEQNGYAQSEPATAAAAANTERMRRLPQGVPVHSILKGLYRRYPVSQVGLPKEIVAEVPDLDKGVVMPPNTIPNAAPFLNLYAPRRTRGIGADKHGLCPICAEPPSRGGRGKALMLNMKTSAFNYHMQYVHGLSPKTGLPFSPPIAFRASSRKTVGAREKATLEEGLCHACSRWIVVEGVKAVDVLVPEIYWWKHASTCHKSRMLEGEGDFYIEDPLFLRIVQWQRDHPTAVRESARATSANAHHVPVKKDDAMDVDIGAPNVGSSARHGAITPVRRDLEDPDSSPLSSLDGTDANSPVRKASAPVLHFPPTALGPFAPQPQSPSTRARSADGPIGTGSMTIGIPPPHIQNTGLGTPQLANHALPGTLPGTPQTTASTTPVLGGTTLPGVYGAEGDHEVRSVLDSGVAFSPHDQQLGKRSDDDAEGEDEDADADAEGEDDPTATAENTPVLTQLPVLTPNLAQAVMSAPLSEPPAAEQSIQMSGVEQVQVHNLSSQTDEVPNFPAAQRSLPLLPIPSMPEASVHEAPGISAVVIPTPVVAAAQPAVETAQVLAQPESTADILAPAQDNHIPVDRPQQVGSNAPAPEGQSTIPEGLSNFVDAVNAPIVPPELPNIQGMDMYASNDTPGGSGDPQPLLTEEDLALATTGLPLDDQHLAMNPTGTDVSMGDAVGVVGAQVPAITEPPVTDHQPPHQQEQGQVFGPGLGLSSGEGTPNAGTEADMFSFWDASK